MSDYRDNSDISTKVTVEQPLPETVEQPLSRKKLSLGEKGCMAAYVGVFHLGTIAWGTMYGYCDGIGLDWPEYKQLHEKINVLPMFFNTAVSAGEGMLLGGIYSRGEKPIKWERVINGAAAGTTIGAGIGAAVSGLELLTGYWIGRGIAYFS